MVYGSRRTFKLFTEFNFEDSLLSMKFFRRRRIEDVGPADPGRFQEPAQSPRVCFKSFLWDWRGERYNDKLRFRERGGTFHAGFGCFFFWDQHLHSAPSSPWVYSDGTSSGQFMTGPAKRIRSTLNRGGGGWTVGGGFDLTVLSCIFFHYAVLSAFCSNQEGFCCIFDQSSF